MKKRKMKMTAALLAAAALLVSGCGAGQTKTDAPVDGQVEARSSADGQEAANVPEDEQKAANGQEAAGQPEVQAEAGGQEAAQEDVLVLAYPKDLGDMNPHTMASPMYAQDWVYDGLTALVNGEIVPELAESWEISGDGKQYTFHLREGVKFSDGSDLTAELFRKNIQDVIDNKDGYTFLQDRKSVV